MNYKKMVNNITSYQIPWLTVWTQLYC